MAIAPQLSLPAVKVMLAGQTTVGGWLSRTVTVKLQVSLLPDLSVAIQTTVLVPIWKEEPEGGLQLTVGFGQLSETVGAGYVTTASHPGPAFAV
jgi:hypothetical protein